MKCPVKSTPDWKALVDLVGEDTAYAIYVKNNEEIPDPKDFQNYINYNLRVVTALNSDKVREPKNNKEGFLNDLIKQGVPKDQLNLVENSLDSVETKEDLKEQLILSTVSGIETAVTTDKSGNPTSVYKDLNVPGGKNYKEVEIRTPDLISPIRGHAEFSTKKGIGWFRADEKENDSSIRRVLEVQSDLFQKRRKSLKNSLLNLLNNDNNWVSFFVRSIIQDSFKKGYNKVLFPSGNTANKVEGQETVDGFVETTTKRLNDIKERKSAFEQTYKKEIKQNDVSTFTHNNEYYMRKPRSKTNSKITYEKNSNNKTISITADQFANAYKEFVVSQFDTEIEALEKELKDVQEGRVPFVAINKFYQDTIKNTLKKRGYNPTEITDEHANTWFEVNTNNTPIAFSPSEQTIEQIYSDLVIPGFSAYTQNEAVNHIAEQVIISIDTTPGISFNQAISKFVNYAEDQILTGNEKYEPIVENIDKFRQLVLERLNRIGLLHKTPIDENDQLTIEGDDVSDSFYWEDDWVFKYNSKMNAQETIKKFLTFIPKTTYEDGEYYEVENYLGTLSFIPYDEVFEDLKAILADTPNNWEAMRTKLEDIQTTKPWIFNLLFQMNNYEGDRQQLINQFVTSFSSTYSNFKTLLWDEDNGTYEFKLIDTDQNSVVKNLLFKWQNNFYTVNVEVGEVISELEKLKDNKDVNRIRKFFTSIGIDITTQTVQDLIDGKVGNLTYEQHFTSTDKGLFNLIKSRLAGRNSNGLDQEDVINPVINNSAIRNLANTEYLYNNTLYSNSLRNGEGNTVYSYSFNKFITKQFQRLQDNDYVTKYSNITFNSPIIRDGQPLYKTWLYELKHNPSFKDTFSISPFDTVKESGREGTKLSKMTDIDLELTKLQLFQNKGNTKKGVGRIANYLFTVPGKTTSYIFTAPVLDIVVSNKKLGKTTKDAIYSIALTELSRINNSFGKDITNTRYKNGSKFFYFFPSLNKKTTPEIWNTDGTVKLPTTNVNGKTVESIIREKIEAAITNDINNKISEWNDIGFIKDGELIYTDKSYKQGTKTDPFLAAADYIVNNTLFEFNLHQTFIGDPALYYKKSPEDTWDEIGKRLAAQIAPGKDLSLFSPTEDFISVKVKDREGDIALNIAELKKILKDEAAPYESLNGTDAQEFTTLPEALLVKYRLGNITSEVYNNILNRIKKDKDNLVLTEQELNTVLQPDKPVYVSTDILTDQDVVSLEYVKSSSIPLLPQFTKGLELDKLRKAMEKLETEKGKPVRLAFDSATKVGGVPSISIFNEDGTIKSDLDLSNNYKVLTRDGFRIQQDVPYDPNYEEVVKSTQATKLLFDSILETSGFNYKGSDYTGKQLKDVWNNLHKQLFEGSAATLQKDITLPDGSLDSQKIQQILAEEAVKREYTPAEIASLSILPDGRFEFPFWALNSSKKFESIITSLYTNRVVKQKMHGSSYVLVSEEGTQGKSKGIVYTSNYEGKLKPMRVENGVVKGAQVLIPWKFKADINKFITDGVIDNTKVPEEVLEQFGFRIPNQGHNSMSLIEVVGFLPPVMGDIVVASRNFITQMGSDFDVDKLYVYDYFVNIDDKVSKQDNIKNDILDIHKTVLKNPKVFKSAVTPLGNVKDSESAKYLKSIYKQSIENRLSPDYKKAKYLESIDGKAMVGIESLASTLNTILQEKDIYIQKPIKADRKTVYVKDYITFGDDKGSTILLNNLSSPLTWRGNSKNSVISADQSAAVDNEKDPTLSYINSNPITAPARTALRQLGLEADHLNYFMAQDVVRSFTKQVRAKRSFLSSFSNNIEETILANLINDTRKAYLNTLSDSDKVSYTDDSLLDTKLTQNQLKKNLTEKSLYIDLQVLLRFAKAYKIGKDLNTIQNAINIESGGVGKSVLEVANKNKRINNLSNINYVANVTTLLGDMKESGLVPNTYSGYAVTNSVLLANDTFSKPNDFFKYGTRSFKQVLEEFTDITDNIPSVDQTEVLWNGLKSFVFANKISDRRKDLFLGKEALAHKIKEFIKTKEGRTNQFLLRLSFDTKPNQPQLISYNAAKEEYVDEINIYRGFLDLLVSPNETTKQLGRDLVDYFYLNGGIQQAREWGKYIHPSYLKGTVYYSIFNETDFENLDTIGYEEGISKYTKQFFQHNPWYLPTLNLQSNEYKITEDTIELTDPLNVKKEYPLELNAKGEYPVIFSIKDSKSPKGHKIYVSIGNNKYQQINVLGATNFTEYNWTGESIIHKNYNKPTKKVAEVKNKPINDTKSVPTFSLAEYTGDVNKVLNNIKDPKYKALVDILKQRTYDNNIEFNTSLPQGGEYSLNNKTIYINPNKVKSVERTILHEVVHAATMRAFYSTDGLTESQINAVESLRKVRSSLRDKLIAGDFEDIGLKASELEEFETLFKETAKSKEQEKRMVELVPKYYGFYSDVEFISELFTREEFQNTLNNIKYDSNRSILDRIVNFITTILKELGVSSNTALEASIKDAVLLITDKKEKKSIFDLSRLNDVTAMSLSDFTNQEYRTLINKFEERLAFIDSSIVKAVIGNEPVRAEQLRARRTEVEQEFNEFKDNAVFEGVIKLANNDLKNVEEILKQPSISHNDINYTIRIIKQWQEASDFVLEESDVTDRNTRYKDIKKIEADASELYDLWIRVARNSLLLAVKEESGLQNLTQEVLTAQSKINTLTANLMDISRTGNIILSVMDKWMRESSKRASLEANAIHEETAKLVEGIKNTDLFKKEGYYLFAQRDNEDNLTGELVRPLNVEYYKNRNLLLEKASREDNKELRSIYWKDYFNWMRENHTFFDIRKLYKENNDGTYTYSPDTEYVDTLKKQFKEKFNNLIEEQKKKIELYNEKLGYKIQSVEGDPEANREIEKWKAANDPTIYLRNVVSGDYKQSIIDGIFVKNEGQEYVVKRANKTWEDIRYNKIQNQPELKAFYDYTVQTLNRLYSFIPTGFKEGITNATIPSIKKNLIEEYNEKGMNAAVTKTNNNFIEGISVLDTESITNKLQDPITGKPLLNLNVRYLNSLSPEERTYDLEKVLNTFATEALNFKHKSTVEDSIRLAQSILEQSLEVVKSPRGDAMINRFGEVIKVKDGKALQEQMEYAIEAFYGQRKVTQGITSKKVYTNKAKTKVDKLNKEIESKEKYSTETKEFINELKVKYPHLVTQDLDAIPLKEAANKYLKDNTRFIAGSKLGDSLLQYMQLKGMGWNIFSSITNVVFGWMSNLTYASGGVDFTVDQMLKANRIMLGATGRAFGVSNPIGRKVNRLMDKYNVLGELNDASYNGVTNFKRVKKGIENLSPYELQRKGEYFVQGMTMVATMLNTKVMVNGVETTLWNAYDNDGNFLGDNKSDWEGDLNNKAHNKEYFKFSNKVDQINKTIHGNYDVNSPVRIKKGVLGRALLQFRSWIAEGVASRLENEKYDLLLGRKRKGRWRTYSDLGFKESLRGLLRIARGKKLDNLRSDIDATIATENMKRNLAEIYQYSILLALAYTLMGLDLDDDDEYGKKAVNLTVNQLLRLQDDIEFYYSPLAIENIAQNALPVFTLVRDGARFLDAIEKGFIEGEWDYKTGKKAGESRILWTGAKVFPFGSSMASFINKTENEESFRN